MTNFDDFKLAVESLSGGRNTVLLDDLGMPSVVVPFPKLNYSDVFEGGAQEPLPAFVVDGQEKQVVYISKYLNVIVNDRAYSLPMKEPATDIDFARALTVCRNKGAGWHLITNAMWTAIAAWCNKNGTIPHGNNNYGADMGHPYEKGVPSSPLDNEGRTRRTATGSGPSTWYHNYDMSGIADLNGNVWEWVSGLRLENGEIQIIPYGNAMKFDCNMSATSTEWKAIKADGTFVTPGATDTLKYDLINNKLTISTTTTAPPLNGEVTKFKEIAVASGITIPPILKALGLYSDSPGYENNGIFIFNTSAQHNERIPYRGGGWNGGALAGVLSINMNDTRLFHYAHVGFRSAFYE